MKQLTRRKYLCGKKGKRREKFIDMEEVYQDIDSGMGLADVAKKYGVSITTLQRRHKKYQKSLDELEMKSDFANQKTSDYKLPPLPKEFGAL